MLSYLDRARTVADMGFNRWLVPPAALAIHLSIGQAYAFSVFNLPLTRILGVTESAPEDWKLTTLGWIFSIAIVFLGLSAAVFGKWLESAGPRKAMFASAICFSGGFFVSALGVWLHQVWLLYLGYGVLGGIGLGLGYIAPVSTLIKWFPDRPGMATGLAIMGFGGGAMVGAPLAETLMSLFRTAASTGVAETFVAMGAIYFCFMMFGAVMVRVPPPGWRPAGYQQTESARLAMAHDMTADEAIKTRQFWLLWVVLFVNVTAGIGVLSQASPMIQELFTGRVSAEAAAGFVGLLSIFNMVGRLFWSSLSDYIGRKKTYIIFFLLGAILYALTPQTSRLGTVVLFVLGCGIIMTMYGGRLRDDPRLSPRPVWHGAGGSYSRPTVDRLVGRRRRGSGAGQLHPPVPARPRCVQGRSLHRDHVHHGRAAACRTRMQSSGVSDQAIPCQRPHDRPGSCLLLRTENSND